MPKSNKGAKSKPVIQHFKNEAEAKAAMDAANRTRELEFRARAARHEAAHIVVGDEIGEEMEWVNVVGKPGVKHAMTKFLYSSEALTILEGLWDGLDKNPILTAKTWDLATCFAAGHLIEYEKFQVHPIVSDKLSLATQNPFDLHNTNVVDHNRVARLLTLIGRGNIKEVKEVEARVLELVEPNRQKLERIIKRLVEKGYIEGQEFIDIRIEPSDA